MFNVVSNIKVTQKPIKNKYPNRNRVINLDFMTSYSWTSRRLEMTDRGSIVFPKNLYFKDESNSLNPLNGLNVNIGGFTKEPLLMRGDAVQLNAGYQYESPSLVRTIQDTSLIIDGYISKVYSTTPIEIEVEDSMWLLKQLPLPTRSFSSSDTLEDILKFICDLANKTFGTTLTFNALTKTNFGTLLVGNETASQLLNRLKTTYGFFSYFRGTELRCGIVGYYPNEAQRIVFIMNGQDGNVCADGQDLEWQRKDDVVLSAIAHNTITSNAGGTCVDGSLKTKKERLEVLVTIKNDEVTSNVITKGERVPENNEGERRTFFFPSATNTNELINLATEKLNQYHYDGLKGKFMTFGIPFVKTGDEIDLRNPQQPEQNGLYKVKGVEYFGSHTEGLKQMIEIDFKIK